MQETKEVAWAVGILAVVVGLLTETLGKLHIAGAVIFTIISDSSVEQDVPFLSSTITETLYCPPFSYL